MRLTDFVWFQRGFDLPQSKFEEGEIPVYGSTSVLGYHNKPKVTAPGIITGRSGTLGKFQYSEVDFWPHNTTLWVKDFKGNDPKFAYYLLQCLDFTVFNSGGAVPSLNRNLLNAYIVNIPSLETQKKIASILSGYDDLIENNLNRIKILEEMAQQTYEEWFVRMRFPGYESVKINAETELPEGWEKVKLGNYINFKKGKKSEETFEEKLPETEKILLLDSLESGKFNYTKVGNHSLVKRGDVLMLMDGARSSYVFLADNGIIGSTMAKVETKNLSSSLLFYYFQRNLEWLQINNTGAAIPHANPNFIKKIDFKMPNKDLLDKWEQFIQPIWKNIWNLKDQNQKLREARDILLPRLMMGMMEV